MEAARVQVGEKRLVEQSPLMGGKDFACLSQMVPSGYVFLGANPAKVASEIVTIPSRRLVFWSQSAKLTVHGEVFRANTRSTAGEPGLMYLSSKIGNCVW